MKKHPNRNTSGLTPFKPGASGNPAGRHTPEWIKGIKLLPKHVASVLWSKWLSMDSEELKRIAESEHTPGLSAIELAMCRALYTDIQKGEVKNLEIALSRIIGKISEDPPDASKAGIEELTHEELMAKVRTALTVLEEKAK